MELRARLHDAALGARLDELHLLADEAARYDPALGAHLRELADAYDYDRVLKLTEL